MLLALADAKVEIVSESNQYQQSSKSKGKGFRVNLERKKSESYTLRAAKISNHTDFAAVSRGAIKSSWFDFDGKDEDFMDEIKSFVKAFSQEHFSKKDQKEIASLSNISHL